MLRKIRNITLLVSAVFCWGIVGGLELSRISLSGAINCLLGAASVCAALYFAEIISGYAKMVLVRIARRRRMRRHREHARIYAKNRCATKVCA